MRTIVIIGSAAGLLVAALPAQAADSNANANANRTNAAAPQPPQAEGARADERQICVREPRSESHIRRLICHTAKEWRDLQGDEPGQG